MASEREIELVEQAADAALELGAELQKAKEENAKLRQVIIDGHDVVEHECGGDPDLGYPGTANAECWACKAREVIFND